MFNFNNDYTINKEKVFKFNDLKSEEPFLALRIEGSKKSIEERSKDIFKELDLKKMKTSILDFYQSKLFWEKINNIE